MEPNILSISSNLSNVRQDVFPLNQWTITTRKGIIMQSKCTCKSSDHNAHQNQLLASHSKTPSPQPSSPSTQRNDKEMDKEPIELCDICRYHKFLPQLHAMPDMLFNNNLLRLEHSSGVGIEFNPLDALRLVEETKDPLKVAVADGWQSARADCPFAKNISRPFDWTFTTSYRGTILSAIKKFNATNIGTNQDDTAGNNNSSQRSQINSVNTTETRQGLEVHCESSKPVRDGTLKSHSSDEDRLCLKVEETDERIDVNKLKVREEILFYDDVTLYEDELADHGTAQYNVKVRVMPNSLFILARYYLRIDGVLARINDTRIYHELNARYFLREYTNREGKLSNMNLPVSTVINPNELVSYLPLIHSQYEKLTIPEVRG